MTSIRSEIVTKIKALTFTYTVADIREGWSQKKPVYPMIVVTEIDNRAGKTLGGVEILSLIQYQIDVLAKDSLLSSVPVSRRTIVESIAHDIDEELNEEYGLTRTTAVMIGDDKDETVVRYTLRYRGVVDGANGITYRRE